MAPKFDPARFMTEDQAKYQDVIGNGLAEFTTVQDLINFLKTCPPGASIRLAEQPGYPLAYEMGEAVLMVDERETEETNQDLDDDATNEDIDVQYVVWFGEGSQVGYLDGETKDALGWSY